METLQEKKLFTSIYVSLHENLSKSDKKIIYDFIEEADNKQIDNLLKTGKMEKSENLNEFETLTGFGKTIIKLSSKEAQVAQSVGGVVAAAAIIWLAMKAVGKIRTKKECKNYKVNSAPWKLCQTTVKIKQKQLEIKMLKGKIGLCKHSKDPKICNERITKRLNKASAKLIALQNKLKTQKG